MIFYTSTLEDYNYEGEEDDDEFENRIEKQLYDNEWYLQYDNTLKYVSISCSISNFKWVQSFTRDEYRSLYSSSFPILQQLNELKWRWFEIQQYKDHTEKISFMESIGEPIDIQVTKNEFEFIRKNHHKIISLLTAYEIKIE